jgi:hypothetical protein
MTPEVAKCHQRVIRERIADNPPIGLLDSHPQNPSIQSADIVRVDFKTAKHIILQYEWLGTMPSGFRAAFGIFFGGVCGGVVVYGSPNPMQIAKSVCGGKYVKETWQLHRGACVWWAHEHSASKLIGVSLREVEKLGARIVVAYSDPRAGEIGTVYQATNWLYCGLTAKRPDYEVDGKRKVGHFKVTGEMVRVDRQRKHKYVHILGNRRERKKIQASLAWPIMAYPKRTNGDQP